MLISPTDTRIGGDVRHDADRLDWSRSRGPIVLLAAAWVASVAIALASRPLLPVDETRYASVAWEMWLRGRYLVPYLNGAPYSDKPPLLFWLILAGWRVTGPVELWVRLVGPACGVASLALTSALAKRLWPERGSVSRVAPIVLAATLVWLVYSTLLLFDTVLTACVLLAVIGIVDTRRGHGHGLVLIAIGTGLGILAKGPVVLIHVLPSLLLVRWWDVRRQPGALPDPAGQPLRHWPLAVAGAMLAGVGIALAWAIPAAMAGGPEYARAIFIGQTAGRVVNSFAHRRPLWWYVPNLFWMSLPWLVWPLAWRWMRARHGRTKEWRDDTLARDRGLRLCMAVVVPAFAIFSVVSGKQVHYLLPEMPFMALAVASLVTDATPETNLNARAIRQVRWVALAAFGILAAVSVVSIRTLRQQYDLRTIAVHLSSVERAGDPIAHQGRYSGQYTFLGRLHLPLAEVPPDSVGVWLAEHPTGRVVTYARSPNAPGPGVAEIVHGLGNRFVIVRAASPSGGKPSPPTPRDDRIRHEPPRIENP